jgi:hemolysin activation/secretion protein
MILKRHRKRRNWPLFLLGTALISSSGFAGEARAQQVPLPGSADPGRFDERFEPDLPPQRPEITEPDDINIGDDVTDAAEGFILQGVTFDGNTAFEDQQLAAITQKYVHRRVDLVLLNRMADEITKFYRDNGYFLAKAILPAQDVEGGIVQILVIEGFISNVRIEDPANLLDKDRFGSIGSLISRIRALDPLHGPSLEKEMLLMNDGQAVRIESIMQPAENAQKAGGVDLVLRVIPQDDIYQIGYNNSGSRFVGPHQFNYNYVTGNLLNTLDRLSFAVSHAIPMSELIYTQLAYSTPLNADGLTFNTQMSYSNSEPGLNLRALEVESDSFSAEAGVSYPYLRSRQTNIWIDAKLVMRNFATEFLDEELIDDKTRSFVLGAQFDHADQYDGVTFGDVSVHQGIEGLGSNPTGGQNLSRAEGRADFTKVRAEISRYQRLPSDFAAIGQIKGQYAPHALLSSEEFGYGGAGYGRAYDPSEITGDRGVATSLEIRYNGVPPEKSLSVTPFVFYDIGKVWNKDDGSKPVSAASAGAGSHYQFNDALNGSISVAWPLTKQVDTPVTGGEDGPRVLFSAKMRF